MIASSTAELSALDFGESARTVIDHALAGNVPTLEGFDQAIRLLQRGRAFLTDSTR